jgi:uncharacterized protein (TIGR03067 family)
MCKYAILLAAAVSLAFAPAPFPKPPKPEADVKNLQGTWLKVDAFPPNNGEGEGILVISGESMRYILGASPAGEYVLKIDPRKKPKVFDFKGAGGVIDGMVYRGIYRLEKNTLTICYVRNADERDRPTSFDTRKEGIIRSVYQRQKP